MFSFQGSVVGLSSFHAIKYGESPPLQVLHLDLKYISFRHLHFNLPPYCWVLEGSIHWGDNYSVTNAT
jgi:hypothetical protein